MILPFIAVAVVAAMLVQLGALSVWVVVLKAMLALALAVVLFFGLLFVWRSYSALHRK